MTRAFGCKALAKCLSLAAVALVGLLGLATFVTLTSSWNGVRIHPTKLHVDASESLPRALLSVDADIDGLDRSLHGFSVHGGRCELFGGRNGVQRLLLAQSREVVHSGEKARLVAELEHVSLKQATQILKEGPARDLLCSFRVEVDFFKTGWKLYRSFEAADFLKGQEDFGFEYTVASDPVKWQHPQNGDMHIKADLRHWIEVRMLSHTPEKLAQFLQKTPVHLKAGLTYADATHSAVHFNGNIDSPLKYKIEGSGKDTQVAVAIPVDFRAAGHVQKLVAAASKAAVLGSSALRTEKNGGVSYSSTFRAQNPRSPLAVALGAAHVFKVRTDDPVDGKNIIKVFNSAHESLLSTLTSMHPQAAERRRASEVFTKQNSLKDGSFKVRVVVSINEDDIQSMTAEIKEGAITTIRVNFIMRRYTKEMETKRGRHATPTGIQSSEEKIDEKDMLFTNVTAGLDVESAKPAVHAHVTFGMNSANQYKSLEKFMSGAALWTRYKWTKEDDGIGASLRYDHTTKALSARIYAKMDKTELEYNENKKDYSSSAWYKEDKIAKIKDPIPVGGLRRLNTPSKECVEAAFKTCRAKKVADADLATSKCPEYLACSMSPLTLCAYTAAEACKKQGVLQEFLSQKCPEMMKCSTSPEGKCASKASATCKGKGVQEAEMRTKCPEMMRCYASTSASTSTPTPVPAPGPLLEAIPSKDEKSKTNIQIDASIDFDGDGSANSKMTAMLKVDLGQSMPMKMDIKYHMKEPKTDILEHTFSMTGGMPVGKITRNLYTNKNFARPTGAEEYWAVSGMKMSGVINTDISGAQILATGTVNGDKMTCNTALSRKRGTGAMRDDLGFDFSKLAVVDAAVCPILLWGFTGVKQAGEASCCSKIYGQAGGFYDYGEIGEIMVSLKDAMPMSMNKSWSDTIKSSMSNFIKSGVGFDMENMAMRADTGTATDAMKPEVVTKTVNGVNHMDIKMMEGTKEKFKLAMTAKDNDKDGKDGELTIAVDGKDEVSMAGSVGSKDDLLSYQGTVSNFEDGVKTHLVTWTGSINRKESVVGKYGIDHKETLLEGKKREMTFEVINNIKHTASATSDEFVARWGVSVKDEGFRGVDVTGKRLRNAEDDDFSGVLKTANAETFGDVPYIQVTGSKSLAGKLYKGEVDIKEKTAQGKQIAVFSGKAEKTVLGSEKQYDMMLKLNADSKDIFVMTGGFDNKADRGIMAAVLKIEGEEKLRANSIMPKAAQRFKGPITVTSPDKSLEIPSDFKLIAEASDGFLTIKEPKFGLSGFTKFDVVLTVLIEKIQVESSFYCEQPPDKLPNAMPWTGLGMRAIVHETKDDNTKHKTADVNWDADLPVDTIMSEVEFKSDLEIEDVTAFDETKFKETLAQESGVDAAEVEITGKEFEVEVGFKFEGAKAITEAEAKTAIAKSMGVRESKLTVKIETARRLEAAARLLNVATKVTATLKTESADEAEVVKTKMSDDTKIKAMTETVTAKLKEDFKITATATVEKKPVLKVKVQTRIKSKKDAPVKAPTAEKLTKAAQKAGAKKAAVVAGSVKKVEFTTPPPPTHKHGEATAGAFRSAVAPATFLIVLFASVFGLQ